MAGVPDPRLQYDVGPSLREQDNDLPDSDYVLLPRGMFVAKRPPTEEEQVATQADRVNRVAGTRVLDEDGEISRAVLEEQIAEQGIDVNNPEVQNLLDSPATIEMLQGDMAPVILQSWRDRYGVPDTPYSVKLQEFGLDDLEFAPAGASPGLRQLGRLEGADVDLKPPTPEAYLTSSETGGIKYRNGVIANPETGEVYFPPAKGVAGSEPWFKDAQDKWSDEKVLEQKKMLVEMGYLPKGASKGTSWDINFKSALKTYHISRYLNYGKPIKGEYDPNASADGTPILNLRKVEGQIKNNVKEQFRRVFGDDPSPGELDEWTRFIIQQGNQMQKGRTGLPAMTAAAEAEERFIGKLESSPAGRYAMESTEENTDLHDSLMTAISATSRLV